MRLVAAKSSGLFKEFVPYEEVVPLFARREMMAFGKRPRNDQPEEVSEKVRLNSNINAAKRAWESSHSSDELYETIDRSYT